MSNLDFALTQSERYADALFIVEQQLRFRATYLIGKAGVASFVIGAAATYWTSVIQHVYPTIGAMAGVGMLFIASLIAYGVEDRQMILPGRLPSDLWDVMVAPQTTPESFVRYLVDVNQRQLGQQASRQERATRRLHRARVIALLSVPATVLAASLAFLAGI